MCSTVSKHFNPLLNNFGFVFNFIGRVIRRQFRRKVVCLAFRDEEEIPNIQRRQLLASNDLGEKDCQFPHDASADEIQDILYQ